MLFLHYCPCPNLMMVMVTMMMVVAVAPIRMMMIMRWILALIYWHCWDYYQLV